MYGVDWNAIDVLPDETQSNIVEVPETAQPMQQNGLVGLNRAINPLRESDFHGIDIYIETLQYIWNRVQYEQI